MPKKAKETISKPAETASADPFESKVDASAPRKKAAAVKTPKSVRAAAKAANTEPAFAEVAAEPVKRAIKVIKKSAIAKTPEEPTLADEPKAVKPVAAKTKAERPKAVKAAAAKKTAPKKAAKPRKAAPKKAPIETFPATAEVVEGPAAPVAVERSRAFNILADVELPKRSKQNRARLLMQSPTKLYFYWSLREDPWQMLRKAFGDAGSSSYMLVVKLKDLSRGVEEMHRVEREGNWWFEVEPNGRYEAEIGFYSPSRPYFRVVYSNQVETPRRGPSLQPARDADWRISANKFAQVLDVSGFQRDAFDVAMVGDDTFRAMGRTELALARLIGDTSRPFDGISHEDIRYALLSLASGTAVKDLKSRIGNALYDLLRASSTKIDRSSAREALTEHFEIEETEWTDDEPEFTSVGGSRLNFPKRLRARRLPAYSPRYNPVSSFALR
ncbi:MAG: hypothetical protein UZ17_ACD001000484 [Acidobacteria bacterium OLB17]|nr:MAG: hypothetical protein UZ17_ACD001000484 [Acidobacteria bacterium OLB17]MCZ2391111.1 DUF4912 domain-containing protein [Acidobacteriota bacterium]